MKYKYTVHTELYCTIRCIERVSECMYTYSYYILCREANKLIIINKYYR